MGIVNYILLIVLRLLNVYFRLIFRSLDPLILKFVGPPTHVTKITYFSFSSMLKTQRVSFLVWLQKQLQHIYIMHFPYTMLINRKKEQSLQTQSLSKDLKRSISCIFLDKIKIYLSSATFIYQRIIFFLYVKQKLPAQNDAAQSASCLQCLLQVRLFKDCPPFFFSMPKTIELSHVYMFIWGTGDE